jgi:hypothetical protein
MAAAIKSNLNLTAQLVEGHNAIFQVTANGQILFDNHGVCGQLPETKDILKSIRAYQNSMPFEEAKTPASGSD